MPKTAPAKTLTDSATLAPPTDARIYTEYMPLNDLMRRRHPENSKDHDRGAIDRSYDIFGFVEVCVLDERSGQIGAGHGRLETLEWRKQQGRTPPRRIEVAADGEWLVPVSRGVAFDSPQALEAYLITANQTTILGGWKEPALLASLQRLQADAPDLFAATGFDADDVRGLMLDVNGMGTGNGTADPKTDKAAELQQKWQCERGQLWRIPSAIGKGDHRLLCGDSTSVDDVARLMDGKRADALINDPPYGMRLDADFSDMKSSLKFAAERPAFGGRKYNNVTGDHEDYDALPVRQLFKDVKEQFWFGADYYATSLGDTMHGGAWLVWDKRLDESADLMFGSCFELLWSAQPHKRDILRVKWAGVFGVEQEPEHQRFHPNHKPVELYAGILTRFIPHANIIVDCYGGAGSNMVACEQLGRQCCMIEIEPEYCSVILERMTDLGLVPERVEQAAVR